LHDVLNTVKFERIFWVVLDSSKILECQQNNNMKSSVFWDITPCSQLKVSRNMSPPSLGLEKGRSAWADWASPCSFIHSLGLKRRNQHEAGIFSWVTLESWRWRRRVPPKRRLTFSGLYGVIRVFKKTEILIATAVRTSDPTQDNNMFWNTSRIFYILLLCHPYSPFHVPRTWQIIALIPILLAAD
jgi:hypothetical protein